MPPPERDLPCVVVGLRVEAGPAGPDPAGLAQEVERSLAATHPQLPWQVRPAGPPWEEEPAPTAPAPVDAAGVLARARALLLAEDLDVAVLVTDRQMRLHGRPVAAQTCPVQQTIALSLPGLAAEPGRGRHGPVVVARTLAQNSRLLVRMVLAGRPWLLAARLSRTLVGAFAATVVAIVTPDVWTLADRMSPLRLTAIALLVLAATTAVLVVGGGLRERAPSHRVHRTVLLHNVAVWTSVSLGVATLFAGLVAAGLAITLLALPWGLVASTVGHPVAWSTMLRVGLLASIVALVGSAFGAGLEDDAAVQRAAFAGSDDAEFLDR